MIDLYYRPGTAALAPHAVLAEVGAEYRLVRATVEDGKVDPPEFARLSPHRRVPVLVDGDVVVYESAACVMYLGDRYPEAGLAPAVGTSGRALWYRWLTYLTNTVQATFMIAIYPERYTADPGGTDGVRERALESLDRMRDFLSGELAAGGPYLLGEQCSSADLYLAMLTRWGRRFEPKWWDDPALGAHFRSIYERPGFRRAWDEEGLDPPF